MKYLEFITLLYLIGLCFAGQEEDEGVKYANKCEGIHIKSTKSFFLLVVIRASGFWLHGLFPYSLLLAYTLCVRFYFVCVLP